MRAVGAPIHAQDVQHSGARLRNTENGDGKMNDNAIGLMRA